MQITNPHILLPLLQAEIKSFKVRICDVVVSTKNNRKPPASDNLRYPLNDPLSCVHNVGRINREIASIDDIKGILQSKTDVRINIYSRVFDGRFEQ